MSQQPPPRRPRRPRPAGGALLSLLVATALIGPACTGGGDSPPAETSSSPQVLPAELLAATWPVRMAEDAARAPFEAHAGWAQLFQRDHGQALAAFAADPGDGRGLARVHAELAAFYRQAALVGARSARNTWGEARAAEDPAEVDYLVGVAAAFEGEAEVARTAWTALGAQGPAPLQAAAAGWRAWSDGGGAWPPDAALTAIPGAPGAVQPGTAPEAGVMPHFALVERAGEGGTLGLGDPTALYLLSRWHEAAARQAAPADAALVDLVLAPWLLPVEVPGAARPTPPTPVSDAWLFGGFALTAEDLVFLAQARAEGVAAVQQHQASSPLAAAVAPAIVDGQVVPDLLLDQSAWLGQQLVDAMVARAGTETPFHQPFARMGTVGVLRAGMIVADANGQFRDAGVLRINALDRSVEAAADPVFLVSVAAWDAMNRNALRAQELVHGLVRRYPPIEVARASLDAMHIRTSRNAAPAAPVH